MPVTAKLSRRFYEQFGDELTNELVDWFNSVDATYQSSLRELNEINFARFDAKLEQRIASAESRLDAKIDGLEARLDARIDGAETRLDARIDALGTRIDDLKIDIERKLDTRFAEQSEHLTSRLAAFESRMNRWMVTLWSSTMLAFVGLLLAVLRSR